MLGIFIASVDGAESGFLERSDAGEHAASELLGGEVGERTRGRTHGRPWRGLFVLPARPIVQLYEATGV